MVNHHLLRVVILTVVVVGVDQAQDSKAVLNQRDDTGAAAQPLLDDDGGTVFIVRRNDASSLGNLRYHGGPVIAEPQQYNIFLGDAWSGLKAQEAAFSNLLSKKETGTEEVGLESYGVRNTFLPSASQEQSFDFSTDPTISDLRIRSLLEGWFSGGTLQAPDSATIYVLFLPPDIARKADSSSIILLISILAPVDRLS